MTGALLCLSIFGLVGWAGSRFVGRGASVLSGLGLVGLALYAAGVVGLPMVESLIALLVASLAVLLFKNHEPGAKQMSYPRIPSVIAVVAVVWMTTLAVILPLEDYDGRAFWLLKAKAIAHELDVDGPFFHDETSMSPRNLYPLLVPVNAAVVMLAAGELDDRHVRLLYVLFAVGLALALREGLARLATPTIGAWSAALVLWLPQIGPEPDGGVLTGSADIALGAFVTCAFFELLEERSAWRFGFWLPMILLTKSEGLPLAVILFGLGCAVFRRRVVASAVPFLLGIALLMTWKRGLQRSDETDYATLIWTLPDRLPLFGQVAGDFLSQIWAFHDWGALWLAVIAAALWLVRCGRSRPVALAAAATLPMVALYAAIIAVADWDLWEMTASVAPRLMTHLLGPALALLGIALATPRKAPDNLVPLGDSVEKGSPTTAPSASSVERREVTSRSRA